MRAPYVQDRGYGYERKCQWLYCTYVQYSRKYFIEDKAGKVVRAAAAIAIAARPLLLLPDKASEQICRRRQRYKDAMLSLGSGVPGVRSRRNRGKNAWFFG